jgi:flavin reductase (DIM6/NTAB) family NADH-FMN oxidoreductase RutF
MTANAVCDTASPPTSSAIDPLQFRQALGQFATGVAVVCAHTDTGKAVGLTINSLASVSLTPPLVLWSIGQHSKLYRVFAQASHYVVNILSSEQQPIAQHFARSANSLDRDAPFSALDHTLSQHSQLPQLSGALAHLECQVIQRIDAGDHLILVGEVIHLNHINNTLIPDQKPLLYFASNYHIIPPTSFNNSH